ncbi:hypothetical protein [Limnohabitans sp. G3-2]|uniref:hypothetical protein n=1 Tax=Limnohabitans sp. G3-2 TaxID=1100711 RepID=UPI000C1F1900|nr:hypothetical protein [Limnohabitans sp. G3-2]PIT72142.1 hypothetical protein B9Z31_13560 [Limnohabitans sp. G3-2]
MAALLVTLGAASAHAQSPAVPPESAAAQSAIKVDLKQFLVTQEAGKEVLKPADAVKPNDLIEYRAVYANQSARVVRDVTAELPIPVSLEYQASTARPRQTAQVTVDGNRYGTEPLMRELPGGKKEPIPPAQYRRLRWTLGQIDPGARVEVSARARVPSSPSAPPSTQP